MHSAGCALAIAASNMRRNKARAAAGFVSNELIGGIVHLCLALDAVVARIAGSSNDLGFK